MKRTLAALALGALTCASPVVADTIKIVVPFAAGGPSDMLARLIAPELQQRLGANVIVENRGGASGAVANETVARSAADGKTLLLASMGSHVIGPTLRPPSGYDQTKAFAPLVLLGSVSALLVVKPQLPVTSLAELIALGKRGEPLSYASSGAGTTMNIAGEMLNAAAGIKAAHVPYRGAGPAINDLLGGHVDFMIADSPVLVPLVKSNSARALALYGSERASLLPDVPTSKELGFPDLAMESWYGVFVPAGVPADIQARLERAILEAIRTPMVSERLVTAGMFGSKDQAGFRAKLEHDFAYWPQAIKKLGIVAD